jgi:alpha-tubulin suppressor-like RCC1 family protein
VDAGGDETLVEAASSPEPVTPHVVVGERHSCALRPDGRLFCWGLNFFGQVGNGQTQTNEPLPFEVPLADVLQVSTRGQHVCARTRMRRVFCWGSNNFGQLGRDGVTSEPTPRAVPGIEDVIDVAAGGQHTCVLHASGKITCWGSPEFGQIGVTGDAGLSRSVHATVDVPDAARLYAGTRHSCARRKDGSVWCWGEWPDGGEGAIGSRDGGGWEKPQPVQVLAASRSLALGNAHTCFVVEDGGVARCMGANNMGQLGVGSDFDPHPEPLDPVTAGAWEVSAGFAGTCSVTEGRQFWCFGRPFGTGAREMRIFAGMRSIAIGYDHACGLTEEGGVACWGDNSRGQIGDGTFDRASTMKLVLK